MGSSEVIGRVDEAQHERSGTRGLRNGRGRAIDRDVMIQEELKNLSGVRLEGCQMEKTEALSVVTEIIGSVGLRGVGQKIQQLGLRHGTLKEFEKVWE